MLLPALFHWSPCERRKQILQQGLVPYSPATVSSEHSYPYVCLSPTPSTAWGLSGDMDRMSEIEDWDLWQIRLTENDEVHVRAEYGPRLIEVRVRNAISADRVWWVATRSPLWAEASK